MEDNMALSFYEYPKTKEEIEKLETAIIQELVPVLNISKNPLNKFKSTLKQLRKNCATMARKNSDFKGQKIEEPAINKSPSKVNVFSKTGVIFIDNITKSDAKSRNIRITVDNKFLFPAELLGHPKTYPLNFSTGPKEFIATYRIGSKDGKSRSGVLKLGDDVYNDLLKIKAGTNLKIGKAVEDIYKIEKT